MNKNSKSGGTQQSKVDPTEQNVTSKPDQKASSSTSSKTDQGDSRPTTDDKDQQNAGTDQSTSQHDRASIIREIRNPLHFFALVVFVVEAGFLTFGLTSQNYAGLALWMAFIILMVPLIIVGILVLLGKTDQLFRKTVIVQPSVDDFFYEVIPTREALYKKAITIVQNAKIEVLDTTWGPAAPIPSAGEQKALDRYIDAKKSALRKNVEYWELCSMTPQRQIRVDKALQQSKEFSKYRVAVLPGDLGSTTMVDFLISDNEEILLSHVTRSGPSQGSTRFLYIKSKEMASIFSGFFHHCWPH